MAVGSGGGDTPSEYIVHHLVNWTNTPQHFIVDFHVVNYDSIFIALFLGLLTVLVLYRAARNATSGVPGRFQAAVEVLVEMVDSEAKGAIHNAESRKFISPLALTVFVWIFLMNFMDLIPVDLIPHLWAMGFEATGRDPHHAYMRVVPTADLSTALGLSFGVLFLCFYYSIKVKGIGGYARELVSAPFGTSKNPFWAVLLGICNLFMQIVEYLSKAISHGMRLFGNMFAGELVFMLIALLGGFATASVGGVLMGIGHILAGTAWALFHLFIITLQAFIFMILALIYLGQAHDTH